jgi:hypothetical protein
MPAIYDILGGIDDPLIDQAIVEAIPTADPAGARELLRLLISRGRDTALKSLLKSYHELVPELQQLIVIEGDRFDAAIRLAAGDPDIATRLNAVELISRCGSYRLAYLLSAQLHEENAPLGKAAAAVLLGLVKRFAASPTEVGGPLRARTVHWLAGAVADACGSFAQHGRHDVLLAALCLAPWRPPELMRRLNDRHAAALPALREIIRRGIDPVVDPSLLALCTWPMLDASAVEQFRDRRIADRVPAIMRASVMIAVPAIRSMLNKVPQGDHLLPSATDLDAMKPQQLRTVPAWVELVHASEVSKLVVLERVALCDDPVTRLAALRVFMTMQSPEADESVATLCFDPDVAVARIALRHLIMRQYAGLTQMTVRLVASPHEEIRQTAERELTRLGFWRLWQQWDQLQGATRKAAARALMKIDSKFHSHIAERMAAANPDERFRAVMMARELGDESFFEQPLIKLVRDKNERVASAAATALGTVRDSPKVAAELTEALKHPDDRVKSNAVESLEKLDCVEQAREQLVKLAHEGGNRSRATALRALLTLPASGSIKALDNMLGDADPRHRVSALWVVEQLGLLSVGRHVAELAGKDEDPRVRLRALRIFRMLAAAHSGAAAEKTKLKAQA